MGKLRRIRIFLSIVWHIDPQYGFIEIDLAWKLSKILAQHESDWRKLT